MNRNELEERLQVLGGDLDRWPDAERRDALALVADDEEARRLLRDFRRADAAVAAAAAVPPAGDLAARIVAMATDRGEQAIFEVTPAGVAGVLAGSLGLAGAGYVAAAAIAGVIVPAALLDMAFAMVVSGIPGGF